MDKYNDKNLLCDVFDAYFYNSDGKLIFMSDNLTSSNIEGTADETEVRNGRGNALFAKIYSNKTIDITLETNAFDFGTLALLCGTSVGTGKGTCYSEAELLTVSSDAVTLKHIPKDVDALECFVDGVKVEPDAVSDKTVTFSDIEDGKQVKIMPYEYDVVGGDYQEIVVRADQFPSAGKLVLKGVEKNKLTKNYRNLTIIIEQASVSSDFSLSTSSEVEPSTTTIKLSALVKNGELMRIVESPYEG